MENRARTILSAASDSALSEALLTTFKEVEKNYFLRSWKTSELDSGHFVESVRRFIDKRLSGAYTPIGATLSTFNANELRRLENITGSEAYRLHIPRALFAIYGLRNKRGVGHLGLVSPNYLDATLIVATCKWILGEILRAESALSFDETASLVDAIVDRPVPGLWDAGSTRRILADGLSLREQILFLLLAESPQHADHILACTGYTNGAYFRKQLRALHDERRIEFSNDGLCYLSPKGHKEAEQIALGASA